MLEKLAWLALAGAAGTLARYGLSGVVTRFNSASFPWGTIVVNITGCFLVGLLWTLTEDRWPISKEARMLVLVGFMGSFTTFSAMVLETGELIRTASWLHGFANVAVQNGIGFVALLAGIGLAKSI